MKNSEYFKLKQKLKYLNKTDGINLLEDYKYCSKCMKVILKKKGCIHDEKHDN